MGPPPPLGDFEQLVLLALVRLGDRAYGVAIHQELLARGGRDVSVAAVYKTLERLEDKGFATSSLGQPTAERGAAARSSSRSAPPACARFAMRSPR